MAARPPRRLKVFQAQFGFYDTVVAAASQAAALRAWGIHQNVFADGRARVSEDAQAIEAALAHPGAPLRRALGSTDSFAVEPASLPQISTAKKAKAKRSPKATSAPAPRSPAPDRSALDAAEAALRDADEARKREEAAIRRRQDELDAESEAAQARYVAVRKAATAAVVAARQAYRKSGGEG